MPTFTLSAVPATRTDEGGYLSTEMRLSDTLGARAQVEARTIEDVAEELLATANTAHAA